MKKHPQWKLPQLLRDARSENNQIFANTFLVHYYVMLPQYLANIDFFTSNLLNKKQAAFPFVVFLSLFATSK